MQWPKKTTCEMEHLKEKVFGNLKGIDVCHIVEQAIQDMRQLGNPNCNKNLIYHMNQTQKNLIWRVLTKVHKTNKKKLKRNFFKKVP
jgi:hypothetical protein